MYSVEEFLEQSNQASDVDDDLERVVEQDDDNGPREDEAEEATENRDDEEGSAKKVQKKVRKPSNRPKLDAERLKGPRGLATMEKLFTKIKFQGNGHEQEDLQAVMRTLQYWCHRLFPKYSFDDCLEHLERLGSKKPVITLKKKILYDLFEDDQPIVNDVDDDINPGTEEAINEFDLLLQQEPIISTLSQRAVSPERIELTEEQKEMIERNRQLAAERRKARLEALQQKQAQSLQNTQLTDEQKEIIERNRQLALERRRAKNISINTSMVPSSQDPNSTVDTVTNSQKSDQSVNFNELVDSFFPEGNEDNSPKTVGEDVDIDDLIEELNPTPAENQIEKSVETNEEIEMEVDDVNDLNVDINDLIEEINTTPAENPIEKSVETNKKIDDVNTTNLIEDQINLSQMDDKSDNINLESSFDINSTKENTTTNLLD